MNLRERKRFRIGESRKLCKKEWVKEIQAEMDRKNSTRDST